MHRAINFMSEPRKDASSSRGVHKIYVFQRATPFLIFDVHTLWLDELATREASNLSHSFFFQSRILLRTTHQGTSGFREQQRDKYVINAYEFV